TGPQPEGRSGQGRPGRNLASKRRRTLRPSGRPESRAAGSEFPGLRRRRDRRRGPVPVQDDQARRLPAHAELLPGAPHPFRDDWRIIRRMATPREETISVGGIDVHAWIGGQGHPLLVLHGAGGNRGFTRWMRQVGEHFTVWAPTHPGFGRSADAEWMDGIDDLARFHLWFIEKAGLGRPHVLGHSIGGWTAADMATMSPGSIDKLVLVAPAGLKPETGEILDVFYHSPAELLPMTVHDPKTIPEWNE